MNSLNPHVNTAEELGKHSEKVAERIEQRVSGVMVDSVNRNTFKIQFETHLPPKVAEIARGAGFQFEAVYGDSVKFVREEAA